MLGNNRNDGKGRICKHRKLEKKKIKQAISAATYSMEKSYPVGRIVYQVWVVGNPERVTIRRATKP